MFLKVCFNWTFSTLSIELARGLREWVGPDTRSIQEPNRPAGTGTTGRERRMPCNSRGPWGLSSDSRGENRGQRHIPRQNGCQWRWKAPTLSHDILLRVFSPICSSWSLCYNGCENFIEKFDNLMASGEIRIFIYLLCRSHFWNSLWVSAWVWRGVKCEHFVC